MAAREALVKQGANGRDENKRIPNAQSVHLRSPCAMLR